MSNLATVRTMYEAFSRGDAQLAMSHMDDHIEWFQAENSPYADRSPYKGRESVAAGVFLRFVADWNDFRMVPQLFHDAGDTITVEGRYIGTCRATGRQVYSQFAHIFTFRNGLIVRFQQYTDTAQLRDALTIDRQPAAA